MRCQTAVLLLGLGARSRARQWFARQHHSLCPMDIPRLPDFAFGAGKSGCRRIITDRPGDKTAVEDSNPRSGNMGTSTRRGLLLFRRYHFCRSHLFFTAASTFILLHFPTPLQRDRSLCVGLGCGTWLAHNVHLMTIRAPTLGYCT